MRYVKVLSKAQFKELDDPGDCIVISIESTDDCKRYWKEERNEEMDNAHILPSSNTVLNLEFDDLQEDQVYGDYTLRAISMKQAMEIIDFVENHPDKDVIVHCTAGKSRSQGVGKFLVQYLGFTGNIDLSTASFRVYHYLMLAWSTKHSEELNREIIENIVEKCKKLCGKWTSQGYLIGAIDAEEDYYYAVLSESGKFNLGTCYIPITIREDCSIVPDLGENVKERLQKVAENLASEYFRGRGLSVEERYISRNRIIYCL